MNLARPNTLEESIISALAEGEISTTELREKVSGSRKHLTKQGFYASLRKLRAEEVVVVYKSHAALNTAWIKDMERQISKMSASYISTAGSSDILALADKESISFVFTNTRHLDTFWGHIQSQIVARTPISEPIYSYDPHYWFYIARRETEARLVNDIVASGRQFLMTVGGMQPLDKKIQSDFDSDERQYHLEALFPRKEYYVTVIDDYITEVTIDPRLAAQIEDIYARTEHLDELVERNFARLLVIKAHHRIKIQRNKRKAAELKRKLGKNFYIRHGRSSTSGNE